MRAAEVRWVRSVGAGLAGVLVSVAATALARPVGPRAGAAGAATARAEQKVLAIVGGEVHPVSGPPIAGATVLVRGERIAAVGLGVAVPAGATVIDAKGKLVTPGLVESASQIGLVEVAAEAPTVDATPALADPVRAAVNAKDAVDLRSTLVPVARRHGLTSAVSAPGGGLVSGRSAWLDLVDPGAAAPSQAVLGPVALNVWLGSTGGGAVGGSRASALARLREVLDDARTYRRERAGFQRNALYKLATSRLDLEALQDALDGKQVVVISVNRASDIEGALDLAEAERLKVALLGVDEGWMVADRLARARVPVIVEPLSNLPDSFEARNARPDNAALLARAGVRVALATRSSHQASGLRFMAGNAVRAGMDHAEALRAVTLTPAELFGVERQYGSLEVGKVANVVVWTGDPFEPASFAETVVVRGEPQTTESRQTRLSRRYLERHGLVNPRN